MKSLGPLNWKAVLAQLNDIALERPRNISKLERHLLAAPHELLPLAVEAAIEDGEPMGQVLAEVLRKVQDPVLARCLYEKMPDRSVTLAKAAVEATLQCLAVAMDGKANGPLDRGELLNNLAVRRALLGDYTQALEAARDAVAFYRQRAKRNSDAFNPHLAAALTTLAVRQADCGLLRPALATAKKAVALCARLFRKNPTLHAEAMALSLMTLSNRHSAVGDRADSLELIRQASDIYGVLAEGDARYTYDHTLSLFNLANRLTEQGRHEEALRTAEAVVRGFQVLEAGNSDAFAELTAAALNTLAVNLTDCGQPVRALASAEKAVERFEKLQQRLPHRFFGDLVSALNTLSECQADLGRPEEALQTARRTVEAASLLRRQTGASATPYLTMALTNLAHRFLLLDRAAEASPVARKAVRLCRSMVRKRPELRPELVNALIHWAESLRASKVWRTAGKAAREAVALGRPMARADLATFGARLCSALGTLASCEANAGELPSALRHQRERVLMSRRLCEISALTHEPALAIGLVNLALCLSKCELNEEALGAINEALSIFEKITMRTPETHSAELAEALEIAARLRAANGNDKIAAKGAERTRPAAGSLVKSPDTPQPKASGRSPVG